MIVERAGVNASQRIDADAREVLCEFPDVFYPERGLHGVHLLLNYDIAG